MSRANRTTWKESRPARKGKRRLWVTSLNQLCDMGTQDLNSNKATVKNTPFSLTYGERDALHPANDRNTHLRTLMNTEEYNEEEQRLNLDLLQERREAATIREAKTKQRMEITITRGIRPSTVPYRVHMKHSERLLQVATIEISFPPSSKGEAIIQYLIAIYLGWTDSATSAGQNKSHRQVTG
ncbi:hypothetical protein Tco_0487840 [Tanacetum coccineum]